MEILSQLKLNHGKWLKRRFWLLVTLVMDQTPAGNITLVNKQFNTPMGLYSEETIAEMLSSQAEVLVEGVLGLVL